MPDRTRQLGHRKWFRRSLSTPMIQLADGATITPDLELGRQFAVTIAGNRAIAAATPISGESLWDGQSLTFAIKQDATGGRTPSWNSIYRFPDGELPSIAQAANAITYITFIYNAAAAKFDCVGAAGPIG